MFPALIKKSKTHFHNLPVGISVILGNNGYIWIAPTINKDQENAGGFVQNLDEVNQISFELFQCLIVFLPGCSNE